MCSLYKRLFLFIVFSMFFACSGSQEQVEEYPPIPPPPPPVAPSETRGTPLSAEQIEEIQRAFHVGEQSVIACYEDEMERRGTKNISGHVMLKVQIGTQSRAMRVDIGECSIENAPKMQDCIRQAVMMWEFPSISSPFWYTKTYALSPAY